VNNYDTRGQKLGALHCQRFVCGICEASEDLVEYAIKFKEMYLTVLFVVPLWSFISTVTNYRNLRSVDEHILMFLRLHKNELCVCGHMFGIGNHGFLPLFVWIPWLEMHITDNFHLIKFSDLCLSMYAVVLWTLYTAQWCQQKWNHGNFLIKVPTVIQIHLIYINIFIIIFMAWTGKIRQLKLMWITRWLFPCMWSI
jgi:hypothetical protein